MKNIGKEVLMLGTDEYNARNGEGAFIRLLDGRILYLYTEYYGNGWMDHATARISAVYSSDEGEHWTAPTPFFEKEEHQLNIMSVSLVRCDNGDLGVLYLEKLDDGEGKNYCMPIFRYSRDDGKTWSECIHCLSELGYYVVNNDRIIKTESGRLLIPIAHHGKTYNPATGELFPATIHLLASDDNGRHWHTLDGSLFLSYADRVGLQEPGIYEYDNGSLWLWCRTAYGYQYQAFSDDGGKTFSSVEPNFYFTSPDAPMQVKKLSKCAIAIFNPCAFNCMNENREYWGSPRRTPFVLALSTDDANSFNTRGKSGIHGGYAPFIEQCYLLESDTTNSYCYPAVLEVEGGFLVAYYHSNGSPVCLTSTKIAKVRFEELGLEA